MKIRLKLFATLAKHLGNQMAGTPHEIELPEGASLGDLVEQLKLPADQVKICFVNARVQELDFQLQDGDEVGVFPPVGGGCID